MSMSKTLPPSNRVPVEPEPMARIEVRPAAEVRVRLKTGSFFFGRLVGNTEEGIQVVERGRHEAQLIRHDRVEDITPVEQLRGRP